MYNTFLNAISDLISDLFTIWGYKTFGTLLAMCGLYMCVKLVTGLFNQ